MLWFYKRLSAMLADPQLNFVCVVLEIVEKLKKQTGGEKLASLGLISVDNLQVSLVQPELWDEHYILQVFLGPDDRVLQNRFIPSIKPLDQIPNDVGHKENVPRSWIELFLRDAGDKRRVRVPIRLTLVRQLLEKRGIYGRLVDPTCERL